MENPIFFGCFGGTTIFGNIQIEATITPENFAQDLDQDLDSMLGKTNPKNLSQTPFMMVQYGDLT